MERDAFSEFFVEFMRESDRAALVLGAAQMDALLETILMKRLVAPKKDLFDFNGPFGSFSSRIDAAHSVAVIDRDFASKLHLVRKIRNECAHDIARVDLNSADTAQRIAELSRSFSNEKFWTEGLRRAGVVFKMTGNSLELRFAVACLIANLSRVARDVNQIDASTARSIFAPKAWD